MAYASWSVVFGEQPSAAKWNILGTNDSSFNDGTGIANIAWNTTALSNPYKFRARRTSALTLGSSTFQKMTFNTEDFDTNNNYDNATNYRYTAPVSGFYQFNAVVHAAGSTVVVCSLYKNGSEYQRGQQTGPSGANLADLVQATAGDYFEIWCFYDGTGAVTVTSGTQPMFSGYLVSRT